MTAMSSSPIDPHIPATAQLPLHRVLSMPASASAVARAETFAVRAYILCALTGVAMIIQSLGWIFVLPLKQSHAVLVERHPDGKVATADSQTQKYEPTQNDLKYFLGLITSSIWTIDRLTTERDLLKARRHFVRDKADQELAEFIAQDTPITRLRRDPGLTRKVTIHGISIFKDGASVDFSTEERPSGPGEVMITRRLATYHFTVVPPSTQENDLILANPAGLYVTHFEFTRKL
jgi:type IV secretory pathway TrbF-like protein